MLVTFLVVLSFLILEGKSHGAVPLREAATPVPAPPFPISHSCM